jgi:hypothetical protein
MVAHFLPWCMQRITVRIAASKRTLASNSASVQRILLLRRIEAFAKKLNLWER